MKNKQIATTEDMMNLIHQMQGNSHIAILNAEKLLQDKIGTMVDYGKTDKDGNIVLEEYEYIPMYTPAWATVIQKFLSDSNITCNDDTVTGNNKVLEDKFKKMRSKRSNVLSIENINKAINE